jgi:hypothetical protein
MKLLWRLSLACALLLFCLPAAKGDTYEYKVTSTFGPLSVTFDLPTFEITVNDVTTFVSGTLDGDALTGFSISGDSSTCVLGGNILGGPCWAATSA